MNHGARLTYRENCATANMTQLTHGKAEWGEGTPSKRGLTLDDINVGSTALFRKCGYSLSFAPRGADFDVADPPSMG
jgi:hypothetical protein